MKTEAYELLQGAIDFHLHGFPDVGKIGRIMDEIDLAKQARDVGMRAIVLKNHNTLTADRAYLIRKIVPGIEVFGGICLDRPVGGLNPHAVKSAVRFIPEQNLCKIVWMPTFDAANHIIKRNLDGEGISILKDGEILPEVKEILNIIADHGIVLGTGHLSLQEIKRLVEEAKKKGIRKTLVTHVESNVTSMSVEDQKEVAQDGVYLEHCFSSCTPFLLHTTPAKIAEGIKTVGAKHCVMSTGLGQIYNPPPVEGLRMFIMLMLANDVSVSEIEVMIKRNPAKLLGLQ